MLYTNSVILNAKLPDPARHRLSNPAEFIILNTKFLVFNTKFIIFNTKCIIFTHFYSPLSQHLITVRRSDDLIQGEIE